MSSRQRCEEAIAERISDEALDVTPDGAWVGVKPLDTKGIGVSSNCQPLTPVKAFKHAV